MWICLNLNTLTEWQHYQRSHKAASTVLIKKICFFQNCSHVGLSADARVSIGGRLADGRQGRRRRRRGRRRLRWNDERCLRWKSEHNRQSHERKDEKCGVGKDQEGKLVFCCKLLLLLLVLFVWFESFQMWKLIILFERTWYCSSILLYDTWLHFCMPISIRASK